MTIIPQLERDLFETASRHFASTDPSVPRTDRRGQRAAVRRRAMTGWTQLRRRGNLVAIAFSVAVTTMVVAVAFIALGHGHPATSSATAPALASSRRELIQTLGVLRTPQTKAERKAANLGFLSLDQSLEHSHRPLQPHERQVLARDGYPQADLPLVRVVPLGDGSRVSIVPLTYRPSSRFHRRAEGLSLSLRVPGSPGESVSPATVASLRRQGLNLFTYAHHLNIGVVVVPDGVSRVTLDQFRVTSRVAVDPALIPPGTSVAHDNVAAFRMTAPTVRTRGGLPGRGAAGTYSTGAYTRMTWFAADGHVIRRTRILIAFNFVVRLDR